MKMYGKKLTTTILMIFHVFFLSKQLLFIYLCFTENGYRETVQLI